MSKRQVIILLGVWIIILPFLGFPSSFKDIFWILTGLILILVAYRIKPEKGSFADHEPYEEHRPAPQVKVLPQEQKPAGIINDQAPMIKEDSIPNNQ